MHQLWRTWHVNNTEIQGFFQPEHTEAELQYLFYDNK
jgi:hypothetical protein